MDSLIIEIFTFLKFPADKPDGINKFYCVVLNLLFWVSCPPPAGKLFRMTIYTIASLTSFFASKCATRNSLVGVLTNQPLSAGFDFGRLSGSEIVR